MHELTLAASLVDLTEEHAHRNGMTKVVRVHVAVGALAMVDEPALRFGFEIARGGTVADAAELCIERVAARASCKACAAEPFEVGGRGQPCPACGGFSWVLLRGDDLRLTGLEGT